MSDLTLATWFHADSPDRPGTYAQALGDASRSAHFEIYLRCVDVFLASARRWNPATPLLVVLNEGAIRTLSTPRREFWAGLDVEIITTANTHVPASDLYARWQNQLFLFDVIDACLDRVPPGAALAVTDSDVVVRGPLAPLAARVLREQRVVMTVGYQSDADIHGLTRNDLRTFHQQWSGHDPGFVPEYLGGEFVAGSAPALRKLRSAVEDVYAWSLQRQESGLPHPTEEAHMISLAEPYASAAVNGNDLVERIWTQPWQYREVSDTVLQKPLWHLPAEKRTGLRVLRRAAIDPMSWFWTASDSAWSARVSHVVGVPHYGARKAASDLSLLGGDALKRGG